MKASANAKKLYRELTGEPYFGYKSPCPKCRSFYYEYDAKNFQSHCRCGFKVKERDLISHIWGTTALPNFMEMAKFYVDAVYGKEENNPAKKFSS